MVDLPNREVDKHGTGTSDLGTGQHPSHLVERNVTGDLKITNLNSDAPHSGK